MKNIIMCLIVARINKKFFLDEQNYFRFLRKMREMNNNTSSDYRDYLFRKIRDEFNAAQVKPDLGYPKSGLGVVYDKYFKELNKQEKLVEVICYSLLPNHYHFILKQVSENGIEKFMNKLGTSYVKYFNFKYKRSGVLF